MQCTCTFKDGDVWEMCGAHLAAVASAVEAERERCVKIALAHGWDEAFGKDAAHEIADAIRTGK